ncbi:MAG: hypothetical protein MUE54_02215 [Anaerolineae bacterium]|nr:hypothetical protein [Anaerolineae bacterium]
MTNENHISEQEQPIFEDDPILGRFVAQYPANRLRLLMISGGILLAVWFVVTVALWNVQDDIAATITVLILTPVALLTGWYALHLWNREVVLYEKGFTYRRGSQLAYIRYNDVSRTRQAGGIIRYLGGIIKRNTFQFTIITEHDEIIPFDVLYKNLDDLTLKVEAEIYRVLLPKLNTKLANGERIPFNDVLFISTTGIKYQTDELVWDDFGGQTIQSGQLQLKRADGTIWHTSPLAEIENIRLFLALLRHYQPIREVK